MRLQQIVKKIQKELTAAGIEVFIQPAVTTSSVYIRLDNGALKSIRVGDHAGKAKYHYGYEIGSHIKHRHEFFGEINDKPFVRIKFPCEMVDELIQTIQEERLAKIVKYSKPKYEQWKKEGGERTLSRRANNKVRREGFHVNNGY